MPRLRKPRRAAPGATLGIAAPAFSVDAGLLAAGEARLREAGYRTVHGGELTARCGYLAGSDARRAGELMELVADPTVDAIVCARGGYGCHRMVSGLDAARVRAARKPLVGYSDVTTLLLWQLRRAGLMGFHGPMAERGDPLSDQELVALREALAGRAPVTWQGRPGRPGRGEGRLVGGSLSLLSASLGTPWEPRTEGALLLFEDVAEKPYALDRMLHHLAAAGKLRGVVGVGVGHLTGCVDEKRPRPTAEEVVEEVLAPLGVPLVFGLPFGHGRPNLPWPMGARAVLDGGRGELMILEAGVSKR